MKNISGFSISDIIHELDRAVLRGDTRRADELSAALFRLQGGVKADAVMPDGFARRISARASVTGERKKPMSKSIKKFIYIAAAALLITALSVTALATGFFGLRDLVIGGAGNEAAGTPDSSAPAASPQDLIALQGYPDSGEYKAAAEWNAFLAGYDTDGAILSAVGNSSNAYTEEYPMYLVYSKDMADKLGEIAAKYGLTLHRSMTVVTGAEELYGAAGTGRFLDGAGSNENLGGYVYDDGTFHYDGQAVLNSGAVIGYQLGSYVKGTFSDTYLNVGDAGSYLEWPYETSCGVTVSLALGEGKALVIAELEDSFVTVNVLAGASGDPQFSSDSIDKADLESFADMFDFTQLHNTQGK